MYFDFDDRYADVEPVGRAINLRDGVGVSIAVHAVMVALLIIVPQFMPERAVPAEEDVLKLESAEKKEEPRFVFVQPRLDLKAAKPPERAECRTSIARRATPSAHPSSTTRCHMRVATRPSASKPGRRSAHAGSGPAEEPAPPAPPTVETPEATVDPNAQGRMAMQKPQPAQPPPGGKLGDALSNLQRYVDQESFDNQRGGTQEFGPAIQFDTKGVEFGPWIRRFVAQVKRNWFVPYAAMSLRGRVVITFFVHRSGAVTDVTVISPSSVDSFNLAARNALLASNPTEPLPPEYPDDKAFFTVTFFYNESPDGRTPQ